MADVIKFPPGVPDIALTRRGQRLGHSDLDLR